MGYEPDLFEYVIAGGILSGSFKRFRGTLDYPYKQGCMLFSKYKLSLVLLFQQSDLLYDVCRIVFLERYPADISYRWLNTSFVVFVHSAQESHHSSSSLSLICYNTYSHVVPSLPLKAEKWMN